MMISSVIFRVSGLPPYQASCVFVLSLVWMLGVLHVLMSVFMLEPDAASGGQWIHLDNTIKGSFSWLPATKNNSTVQSSSTDLHVNTIHFPRVHTADLSYTTIYDSLLANTTTILADTTNLPLSNTTNFPLADTTTSKLPLADTTTNTTVSGRPELSSIDLALTSTILFLGWTFGASLWSALSDRWGRRRTCSMCFLALLISDGFQWSAPTFDWFLVARFLLGTFQCAEVVP